MTHARLIDASHLNLTALSGITGLALLDQDATGAREIERKNAPIHRHRFAVVKNAEHPVRLIGRFCPGVK
jgi:hypothetical protein